jgi:hypothetical protein
MSVAVVQGFLLADDGRSALAHQAQTIFTGLRLLIRSA